MFYRCQLEDDNLLLSSTVCNKGIGKKIYFRQNIPLAHEVILTLNIQRTVVVGFISMKIKVLRTIKLRRKSLFCTFFFPEHCEVLQCNVDKILPALSYPNGWHLSKWLFEESSKTSFRQQPPFVITSGRTMTLHIVQTTAGGMAALCYCTLQSAHYV